MKTLGWVAGLGLALVAASAAPCAAVCESADVSARRAVGAPGAGERAGMMLERARSAMEGLNLTDDQKTKVEEIFKKARTDFEAMRPDLQGMDPQARYQKIGEFIKGVREQLSQVLTADQRAEMDKKLAQGQQGFRGAPPTSGPAGGAGRGGGLRGGANGGPNGGGPFSYFEKLRDNLAKLDLSDDQKAKIKDLAEDLKAKGQALREEMRNGGDGVRDKVRDLYTQTKQKVGEILTPDQQEKLRELMGRPGDPPTSGPAGGAGRVGGFRERFGQQQRRSSTTRASVGTDANKMADDKTMTDDKAMAEDKKMAVAANAGGKTATPKPALVVKKADGGVEVGQPAPPIALKKVDGSPLNLSAMKGRVVVLEFGSWTSPAFRERALAMEKLKTEYGQRAQFFVVYTREAHAKGEWEVARNKDANIEAEQPATVEARIDLAKKAREQLKITVPMAIDTIANEAATAYGAGANSAVVINRDGLIAAKQEWFDPGGLRRELDDAIKAMPATKPSALGAKAAAQ